MKESELMRQKADEMQDAAMQLAEDSLSQEILEELADVPSRVADYFLKGFEFNSRMERHRAAGAALFADWVCKSTQAGLCGAFDAETVTVTIGPFRAKFSRSDLFRVLSLPYDDEWGGDDDDAFDGYVQSREIHSAVEFERG
ncbi:hypothetical protein [Pseudomonas sp. TMP25]|uniref:hypothetical protein n=1 Tax=Pseudomonas sp. TMP25 TaxID=3136561 RepID=UPI003100AD6C